MDVFAGYVYAIKYFYLSNVMCLFIDVLVSGCCYSYVNV